MKYKCGLCYYSTSRPDHWKNHILTMKHKRRKKNSELLLKSSKLLLKSSKVYDCKLCEKKYKYRQGLYVHKKNAHSTENKKIDLDIFEDFKKQLAETKKNDAALRVALCRERVALCQERAAHIKTSQKATSDTQQNFNVIKKLAERPTIMVFLNQKCQNAAPLLDFIKTLHFPLTDINPGRPLSSIESISNCIVKELKMLDDTERPIHCSDAKRLNFYVKDASGWAMDTDNKKIDKALGWANSRHQSAWHSYAKKEGIDKSKVKDTDYHNMNVAMAAWSDNPEKAKKKVKRAIATATNLKKSKLLVDLDSTHISQHTTQ